jgi:PAS domain S-box-containing protein
MSENLLTDVMTFVNAGFPADGLKASLVLAVFSTWVVISVFAYLNLRDRKSYFRFWAVAWLYYSLYLTTAFGLGEWSGSPVVLALRCACIGITALCLFWGSFQLSGRERTNRELGLGLVVTLVWIHFAVYQRLDHLWITLPVFLLLALACGYTAVVCRQQCPRGANVLTTGFLLWPLPLLTFPFQNSALPGLMTADYLVSAVIALCIALGMLILTLEEARNRNETLSGELNTGVAHRRLLEQEISVSEQKYRLLFDSASDAIFLVDLASLEIVEANPAATELAGRAADKLVGRSLQDLCPKLRQCSASLLENKKVVEGLFDTAGEFHLVRGQGEQMLCEGSATLVDYHQRPVMQMNAREITGRKKMEQQLRQAEKLSALGQLVAGVAHELNNPLAVVMGYAQILSKHKALDEKVKKDLLKVLHESERAAKIVRNLLTFARPREPHMAVVDVNRLVAEALDTRDIQVQSANVQVLRRLAPDLPPTKADADQIEQVMANLMTNAIQALDNHLGKRVIEVTTEKRGDTIRIVVADSGPGIPLQILDRIFDPFFTTKGPGKGTGLGLSICYSIMEEHKGKIWVESEVGKGARFIAELPIVVCRDLMDEGRGTKDDRDLDPAAPQHRLLIVDDEPGIVDVLQEVLGTSGYRIETASNGAKALSRLGSQDYDLIISDLCMPEMSGEKLYAAIREHYPHMLNRIIFLTGDTVSPGSRSFLEKTGARWLSKPFNIAELERVVASYLRAVPAPSASRQNDPQPTAAVV